MQQSTCGQTVIHGGAILELHYLISHFVFHRLPCTFPRLQLNLLHSGPDTDLIRVDVFLNKVCILLLPNVFLVAHIFLHLRNTLENTM